MTITIPEYTSEIVLENKQTQQLNDFFLLLADNLQTLDDAAEFMQEVTGTGSPEGVVSALAGKRYRDTNGVTGAIMYVKNLDDIASDTTQGWILV